MKSLGEKGKVYIVDYERQRYRAAELGLSGNRIPFKTPSIALNRSNSSGFIALDFAQAEITVEVGCNPASTAHWLFAADLIISPQ